jgi:hypothetical protein
MGEKKKFDQKACVPITKRHEFIGQALRQTSARGACWHDDSFDRSRVDFKVID